MAAQQATRAGRSSSEGLVLGRTIDGGGASHVLVLNGVPALQQVVQQDSLFAVISGSAAASVDGDAAVGAWRFVVGADATRAPLVVLKFVTGRTVAQLAADPSSFAAGSELNDDVQQASTTLSGLVEGAVSEAGLADGGVYRRLAQQLTDPGWTGVLIFNATVPELPGQVAGRSTGALAGAAVPVHDVGFEGSPPWVSGAAGGSASFFATIDYSWVSPATPAPRVQHLRAGFANDALVSFAMTAD